MNEAAVTIFISHRPSDSAHVSLLQDALGNRFGRERVVTLADVARRQPGAPVSRLIEEAIGSCDLMLAVIGKDWVSATDEAGRRVDDPDDRPRRELEAALKSDRWLIPVLVEGAQLPGRDELPETLHALRTLHAVQLADTAFSHGVGRLAEMIDDVARRGADRERAEREAAEETQRQAAEAAEREAAERSPAEEYQPEPSTTPAPEREVEDLLRQLLAASSLGWRPSGPEATDRGKGVRVVFGLLGIAAGVAAAIYAQSQEDSIWLSVFVGLLTLQLVSRGIADVITDRKKVRRALYFLLLPAVASASFYFAYQAWDKYWLAFVVGVVGGGMLNAILAPILFPAIHREELEDTRRRWRVGGGA